jgi:flagellar protein FliO/FliZ
MRKSRRRHRALRAVVGLAIILALGFAADAIVLMTTRAHADAGASSEAVANGQRSASAEASGDRSPPSVGVKSGPRPDDNRAARATLFHRLAKGSRPGGSDPWSLGMIGVTVGLAVLGGIVAVSRRFLPQTAGVGMHVVGRVSLSPKHTVYMLRVGRRVLLVGAGPQGSPSLITELDDLGEIDAEPPRGEQA